MGAWGPCKVGPPWPDTPVSKNPSYVYALLQGNLHYIENAKPKNIMASVVIVRLHIYYSPDRSVSTVTAVKWA